VGSGAGPALPLLPRLQGLLCPPGKEGVAPRHGQLCFLPLWGKLESSPPVRATGFGERGKEI